MIRDRHLADFVAYDITQGHIKSFVVGNTVASVRGLPLASPVNPPVGFPFRQVRTLVTPEKRGISARSSFHRQARLINPYS